jgi:hypothetical protein
VVKRPEVLACVVLWAKGLTRPNQSQNMKAKHVNSARP